MIPAHNFGFSIEKLKMKLSSAQLISRKYNKIIDNLKEDTQNYPWKLDELGKT